MINNQKFRLFNEHPIYDFLRLNDSQIEYEIDNTEKNEILNADQTAYVKYLIEKFTIELLNLHIEDISVDLEERDIPAERHPRDFTVWNSGMGSAAIKRMVLKYCIPFSGNTELLRIQPSSHSMSSREFYIQDNNLCFDIIDFYNSPQKIKDEAQIYLNYAKEFSSYLNNDIRGFNSALENKITRLFTERKNKLLQQDNILGSLGVPIKKKESGLLNIPVTRRKIVIKPVPNLNGFTPEPAISNSDYMSILGVINEIGKSYERLPSNYTGKDEEGLRDLFLSHLSLAFESASITGETFNKKGKTDILIKYQNNNVFVAECKFWRGPQKHTETIDQLLSYLTWRDSKTSLIYFVDNKNFQPVLDAITAGTPQHPCYVKTVGNTNEAWFNYHFSMLNDQTRGVEMGILVFHFPK
ncbi:TPA: hypothetical protein NGH35_002815 [Legionella pneumophila]|nr:hypothetical protein [Legionella pneumophila]